MYKTTAREKMNPWLNECIYVLLLIKTSLTLLHNIVLIISTTFFNLCWVVWNQNTDALLKEIKSNTSFFKTKIIFNLWRANALIPTGSNTNKRKLKDREGRNKNNNSIMVYWITNRDQRIKFYFHQFSYPFEH